MRSLPAWFFDGHCLRDVDGRVRWTEVHGRKTASSLSPVILLRALIAAGLLAVQRPWDAVLVDEAHAARRRVFGGMEAGRISCSDCCRRPCPGLFRCLWLLTQHRCNSTHTRCTTCYCCVDSTLRSGDAGPTSPPFKDSLRDFGTSLGRGRSGLRFSDLLTHCRGAPELDATESHRTGGR